MKSLDEMFYGCTQLTYITIKSHIKTVGVDAFQSCSGIYRIDIEDGVETIRNRAFEGCKVYYQFIPSTVTTLEGSAFHFDVSGERFYTPYNIVKYDDSTVPSGWSHYFSGHEIFEYTLINSGLDGGCSRSHFNELAEQHHFFD